MRGAELAPMGYPKPHAIRGYVHRIALYVGAAEHVVKQAASDRVVIAGDEYDSGSPARFAQNGLDDIVVGWR